MPRLVIAGAAGDSGKTIVSLVLLLAARERGQDVRAFKKGPDYIDAAWLAWASGHPARNLDTCLMGFPRAVESFARHAVPDGLNVIEGNRGLYDGSDARGTHSTAELAKALDAPVLLVVNASKVTRTAAAVVLGCQRMDPAVRIAGVVLNQVARPRHEAVLREAIESVCGIPVLGALPRVSGENPLPGRHLGLVPPAEHTRSAELRATLLDLAAHFDLDRIAGLPCPKAATAGLRPAAQRERRAHCRIGYLRDSAFTFYYPENLEALEDGGAELVPVSALSGEPLPPDLHALYIGGGFPETHAAALAQNRAFLASLKTAAQSGLPIYAECGGLMLLSRAILWQGGNYPMAGVLPFSVEVCPTPQGHGYARLRIDRANPFFPQGALLAGHEFHYSRIVPEDAPLPTAAAVERGTGTYAGRDGVVIHNVWASYTHIHAVATPEWAAGLLNAAQLRHIHYLKICSTSYSHQFHPVVKKTFTMA